MFRTDWVVKASRLCNLRCQYCYEWPHLADPSQLSLKHWTRVLDLAREVHIAKDTPDARTRIVWHGGEPLLLPRTLFDLVLRLQAERFLEEGLEIENTMQTNLFRVDWSLIEHLVEVGFSFGVSYDGAPGVRVDSTGRHTEATVLFNIERLRKLGARFGIIVVVAKHTVSHLDAIYEWALAEKFSLRLLPEFEPTLDRSRDNLIATDGRVANALATLFKRWLDDGGEIPIQPFNRYLETLTLQALDLSRPRGDRLDHGDSVVIVDPDGYLYTTSSPLEPVFAIGHADSRTWSEIVQKPQYRKSILRERVAVKAACGDCTHLGRCNGEYLLSTPSSTLRDSCGPHRSVLDEADRWPELQGIFRNDELLSLFEKHVKRG